MNRDESQTAGGGPAACKSGGAWGGAPMPILSELDQPCQVSPAALALATEAQRKAERSSLLASCCQAAGDRAGFWHWRRQMLLHQSIFRALLWGDQ